MGTADEIILYDKDITLLKEVGKFIDENYDQNISIEGLSKKFMISHTTLRRYFLAHYKETIGYYIRKSRLTRAMTLLTVHSIPISQLGMSVGYNHRSAFTHAFTKFFGNPPAHFLKTDQPHEGLDRSST